MAVNEPKQERMNLSSAVKRQAAASGVFDGVLTDVVDRLLDGASVRTLVSPDVLFRAGENSDALYLILTGSVSLHVNGQLITRRTAGEWIGEQAIVDTCTRSADVMVDHEATVLAIDASVFLDELRTSPELCLNFLRLVSEKLRQSTRDRGFFYAREHAILRSVKSRTSREAFQSILSDFLDTLPELGEAPDPVEPREEIAVIVATDIRGFTKISESLALVDLQGFLNDYLTYVAGVFARHGIYIDKYMGDGVLAYGLFSLNEKCCESAVRASIEVVTSTPESAFGGISGVITGIGIHYGTIMVGDFGARRRLEYTIIGDPVNVSSRLQDATKTSPSNLLISSQVHLQVPESLQRRFSANPKVIAMHNRDEKVAYFEFVDGAV